MPYTFIELYKEMSNKRHTSQFIVKSVYCKHQWILVPLADKLHPQFGNSNFGKKFETNQRKPKLDA